MRLKVWGNTWSDGGVCVCVCVCVCVDINEFLRRGQIIWIDLYRCGLGIDVASHPASPVGSISWLRFSVVFSLL